MIHCRTKHSVYLKNPSSCSWTMLLASTEDTARLFDFRCALSSRAPLGSVLVGPLEKRHFSSLWPFHCFFVLFVARVSRGTPLAGPVIKIKTEPVNKLSLYSTFSYKNWIGFLETKKVKMSNQMSNTMQQWWVTKDGEINLFVAKTLRMLKNMRLTCMETIANGVSFVP